MFSVVWGILESNKLTYQGKHFEAIYVKKEPHFRHGDCAVPVNQFFLSSGMQVCAALLTNISPHYGEAIHSDPAGGAKGLTGG